MDAVVPWRSLQTLIKPHYPKAAFSQDGKVKGVLRRASKGGSLDAIDAEINRIITKLSAKVEHRFRTIKRQFGLMKTRFRSLTKNRGHLFTQFGLGIQLLVQRRLLT